MSDTDLVFDETTIPNGIIIKHPSGTPAFASIDDHGQIYGDVCEMEVTKDWLNISLPEDVLVFVHSIAGDGAILTKRLFMVRIETQDAQGHSVWSLLTTNRLQTIMNDLWVRFMDGKMDEMKDVLIAVEKTS